LDSALRQQRYEDAARLRDQIKQLQQRRNDQD
jgi:protein-arginine kinase activator protein McsA